MPKGRLPQRRSRAIAVAEDTQHRGHMQFAHTDERLRGASRRRLVIIADNSLIIEAIYIGLRKSGEFNVVGYADGRKTSAGTIAGVEPDVVLLDDMGQRERATEIISGIKAQNERIAVIVLGRPQSQRVKEVVRPSESVVRMSRRLSLYS